MKTNALYALFLAAVVAFVTGCEPTPQSGQKLGDWQSKIPGSYVSVISGAETEYPAKTVFAIDGGTLSGTYALEHDGTISIGTLSEFSVTGERKLKCRWLDDSGSVGDFELTFSEDLFSFKGQWKADSGDGSGAWNGNQ